MLFLLGMFDQFANKAEEKKTSKETASQNLKPSISPSPSPASSPITTSASPSPANNPQVSDEASFVYPNSTITSQSENSYELRTSDDPETVTNWYREKVNAENYSAKSVVKTKTNGNVLNKIFVGGLIRINIEIKRFPSASHTEIKINF